jgi:hypothetical protein
LRPDRAEFYTALARIEPSRAAVHLQSALSRNPYLTRSRIELAGEWEDRGDPGRAEAELLEAARRDRQFAASWALANFYFRNERPEPFWLWARRAAEMSYGNLDALFDLCFQLSGDAGTVLDRVVVEKRPVEIGYLAYLLDRGRVAEAGPVVARIAASLRAGDRPALLAYIDRAIEAGRATEARGLWDAMSRARLLDYPAADGSLIVNGDFSRPILNRGFDWRRPEVEGISLSASGDERPELTVTFSGRQPEACAFLGQPVPVREGGEYVMAYEYRTSGISGASGLFWSAGGESGPVLAASDAWISAEWRFRAPAGRMPLTLSYRRVNGTTRIEGTVELRGIRLLPCASGQLTASQGGM